MAKYFKDKKIKRTVIAATVMVSAAAFAILSRNTVFAGKKLALSSKNLEITEGSYKTLKLDGAGKKARWSIKKGKDIITLKDKKAGSVRVYGNKEGSATVQAKFKGKAYTCNVKVTAKAWQEAAENTPLPDGGEGVQNMDIKERSKEWDAVAGFGSEILQNLWKQDENI